jgi:Protein of unknown function (DUF2380)
MGCRTFVRLAAALASWPVLLFAAPSLETRAAGEAITSVVVADFDYSDTSGEVTDQRAEHAARVKAFAGLLRDRLAGEGKYKVLHLDCAKAACSVGSMGADDLVAAAQNADAQLLVYGGIHKMSTLITWGSVQVVDVRQKQLLLNRLFSFRGDTDEAFRRAAKFISETLRDMAPKS